MLEHHERARSIYTCTLVGLLLSCVSIVTENVRTLFIIMLIPKGMRLHIMHAQRDRRTLWKGDLVMSIEQTNKCITGYYLLLYLLSHLSPSWFNPFDGCYRQGTKPVRHDRSWKCRFKSDSRMGFAMAITPLHNLNWAKSRLGKGEELSTLQFICSLYLICDLNTVPLWFFPVFDIIPKEKNPHHSVVSIPWSPYSRIFISII